MLRKRTAKKRRAIHESIDSYPGGLIFSTIDGMPILVNSQMNLLAETLTGRTVIDADWTWEQLSKKKFRKASGAVYLQRPWMKEREEKKSFKERLYIQINNGKNHPQVWCFEKQQLAQVQPPAIQISAIEMTEWYELSEKLYENNERLRALQKRQKALLDNIVQINQEKEILETKARIHDELGRCILATRRALKEQELSEDIKWLKQEWKDTIRAFVSIPSAGSYEESTARAELEQVAGMIGCRIQFEGELPRGNKTQQLIFMAIREALTNAVRHGNADVLRVQTVEEKQYVRIRITNNGIRPEGEIREGGGLSNLRLRLEQEQTVLRIYNDESEGVCLELMLHKDREKGE